MMKRYSIAEARDQFAAIVQDVERTAPIEVTRRGKPVAVLISLKEYQQLSAGKQDFWDAYLAFRDQVDLEELAIDPALFEEARDQTPGREVAF